MTKRTRIFSQKNSQRGDMLIELLVSVALVALVMPFLFGYQHDAVVRAQNVSVVRNMENIQDALERYIVGHRDELMSVVGRNITRVNMRDLLEYGVNENLVASSGDRYQLRVVKSGDATGRATLQGVVVFTDEQISPLRTRQIVAMGGGDMGFIDGTRAYGTYGAWRADTIDLGVAAPDGIVGTTGVRHDDALYLWRVPSGAAADATMMSALNLGGHDISDARFFDGSSVRFGETLHVGRAVADKVVFQNRTTMDKNFFTQNATCAGSLSADSRNMEVSGVFALSDVGKFSNFTTQDLWTGGLTLTGISIDAAATAAVLKVNRALDITLGRIDTIYATVGFAGSITPRLVVNERIEDSTNPSFYWDMTSRSANFYDVSLAELTRMAPVAVRRESANGGDAARIFGAVAANKNATAADFMNAIAEIQMRVRTKYRLLNLE